MLAYMTSVPGQVPLPAGDGYDDAYTWNIPGVCSSIEVAKGDAGYSALSPIWGYWPTPYGAFRDLWDRLEGMTVLPSVAQICYRGDQLVAYVVRISA
jgi:hypothetical protein